MEGYQLVLEKQERLKGLLEKKEIIDVWFKEKPHSVLLDWKTLAEHGAPWRYLLDHYHVADLRFSSVYASSAVGALAVIVQQLHSGDAQGAITQIIRSLPALIPPIPGS